MKILITGGASGLGEAITRKLASDSNNTVYFTYYNSENNARILEKEFLNVRSIHCNFSNNTEIKSLSEKLNTFDIDVLVNNAFAGDFLKTLFHKIDAEDFAKDFMLNIIPTIELTKAAIACFRKKKSGKIITILTSALVNTPPIGSAVYVANKAYLAQLSKVWATENSKYNISSNTISPSFMETKFTSSIDERMVEQMKESHPLKRLLNVNEVADSVHYLVHASSQINGIDLLINSGTSLK